MSGADRPLSKGEDACLLDMVEHAFDGEKPDLIGVAVSGGGDSMALLQLVAHVQAQRGGAVCAVTVDHRLRPEAADEARFVAASCGRIGVVHETLVWDHGAIAGNLQDQARRARYRLVGNWAKAKGIGHVLLGHTADDQAETFIMELAREAGIDGLSGMRRCWSERGIKWARPLLGVPRAELRGYLERNAVTWIDDPSNDDERFTRVKSRRMLKALKPLGITAEKLAGVAVNLSVARQALVEATAGTAERIAAIAAGEVVLDRREFQRMGPEISRRILIGALRWVSGAEYAPRADAVIRVLIAIGSGRDTTLSGCRIRVSESEIRIVREPKAVAGLEGPTDALWDGRWRLSGPHGGGMVVGALGAEGLRQCPDWRATGHSRSALIVSPGVWCGQCLVAAPVAGLKNGWTAKIVAGFHSFLLSH